jgi:hypothetical protein
VNKITLITPPDFYENSNTSLLVVGFSEEQQDASSKWLSDKSLSKDINLYFYQGEDTYEWLLYALARADYVYVNADNDNTTIQLMLSYMISRPHVFYSTASEQKRQLFGLISNSYVNTVEDFFERTLND